MRYFHVLYHERDGLWFIVDTFDSKSEAMNIAAQLVEATRIESYPDIPDRYLNEYD